MDAKGARLVDPLSADDVAVSAGGWFVERLRRPGAFGGARRSRQRGPVAVASRRVGWRAGVRCAGGETPAGVRGDRAGAQGTSQETQGPRQGGVAARTAPTVSREKQLPRQELVPGHGRGQPGVPGADGVRGQGPEHVLGAQSRVELRGHVRGEARLQEPAGVPAAAEERQREAAVPRQGRPGQVHRLQ